MPDMKKFLLIFLLVLVILGAGTYFYINKVFLPYKLKELITTKLQESTGRKIIYSTINFHFPKGLDILDLTIYEKDGERIFLKIPQVSFNVLLTGFIKNKNIVIPTIKIVSPSIHLERLSLTEWNFSDFQKPKAQTSSPEAPKTQGSSLPFNILVRKIILENGQIDLADMSEAEPFKESFKNIQAAATLHLNKSADLKLSFQIPERSSSVSSSGTLTLDERLLKANVVVKNLALAQYLKRFMPDSKVVINDGLISSADLAVVYSPKMITAQGHLDIQSFSMDSKDLALEHLESSISLPEFSLVSQDGRVRAKGNAKLASTKIRLKNERSLETNKANLQINELSFEKDAFDIKGNIVAEKALLHLGTGKQLSGDLSILNAIFNKRLSEITFKSDLTCPNAVLTLAPSRSVKGEVALLQNEIRFNNGNLSGQTTLDLKNADIQIAEKRFVTGDLASPRVNFSLEGTIFSVQAQGNLQNGFVQIDEEKSFKGNPKIEFSLQTDTEDPTQLIYNGQVSLIGATLKGLPKVNELNDVTGQVGFKNDFLKLNNVSLNTLDTSLKLSGTISHFDAPSINMEIVSDDVDLAKIFSLLPEEATAKIPVSLSGHTSIKANFNGTLASPQTADISCQANFKNITVNSEKLPSPVTSISGNINYSKDLIIWKDIEATYEKKIYVSAGKIIDFESPSVDMSLGSDELSLIAQVSPKNNVLDIERLHGKFLNSEFDVDGQVDVKNSSEPKPDLSLTAKIDLNDLNKLPMGLNEKIKPLKPQGIVSANGTIQGQGKNWKMWTIDLKAQSPQITFVNYPIKQLQIGYLQQDGVIDHLNIDGKVYDGELKFLSKGTLKDETLPIELALGLERMNLETLRKEQKLKVTDLQGMLSFDLVLNGPLLRQEKLKGSGYVTVSEGILWEWNILKGIFGALLIPEFQNVIFTDAHADFTVDNRKVSTQNAQLISKSVTLDAKGWIDFDKNIDFDVNPVFSEVALLASDSLRKAPTNLLTQSIGIHITGTIKDPKFRADTSVKKVIQNTTGVITDTIKGVIDQVF